MTDTKLSELLEHAGNQIDVGPPPLDALYAGARRRRHRRTAAVSAVTAAAVVAAVGGTTLLTSRRPEPATSPPVAMRLVGFGHVAIGVPAGWGRNQSRCGIPQKDTVIIDDLSAVHLCMAFRPAGVESVEVQSGVRTIDGATVQSIVIDGVRAERQRTTCVAGDRGVPLCTGAVDIPSRQVWFRAVSSTSAQEVDQILERISIVPDKVGIPSYLSLTWNGEGPFGPQYAAAIEQAGLKPKLQKRKSSAYPSGAVLGVSPAVGTMVGPGTTVTVTVAQ